MASTQSVGIDLGTTFSAVAHLDDQGTPQSLINTEGDVLTPSTVFFEGDNIVVGKEALKAIATDANDVAQFAKRDLGHRTFHKVLGGRQYPPEAILAFILHKLRMDAERQIGPFTEAVITVPAYFDEVRRKATQDAGYMAGLNVLDIVNEPTSAAIAFGFRHGFLNPEGTARAPCKVLVYDLGGGTFDVTVMEIGGSDFAALATDGDVHLGGYDFDQRLIDYAAQEFIRTHRIDPREDPTVAGRLWRECEDAKRTLSARQKTYIACDYQGKAIRVEMTRQLFEDITRDLLDRTQFTTRQTLRAAGLEWNDIDHVLLVGGSTRIPSVVNMLKKLTGKIPNQSVSADEAVAHGAALHASLLLARSSGVKPRFTIKNVNSHSLGVVATDAATNRKRNAILIPRNSPLPATAKRIFKTQKRGQKSILVRIIEGESASPDECSQIGSCSVRDLPQDLAAQSPVEIVFRYQENGRLTVTVRVAGSKRRLTHEITRENSLTPEQMDQWRRFIAQLNQ